MLFDLRSRGRRRTVRVVYVGLALLIGAGLVLFGVGTGSSGGGLFGALSGNSSSSSDPAVTKAVKEAAARTTADPNSAAAWAGLISARYSAANSIGYDTTTSTYTTAGREQLQGVAAAETHYAKLTKQPDVDTTTIVAHAYSELDDYASAATAYQTLLGLQPGNIKNLECIALASYAAGNTRVGALAQSHVLAKLPKSARKTTASELEEAKTSKSVVSESC